MFRVLGARLWLFFLLLLPGPVIAQGILNATVNGSEIRAQVALPSGLGADFGVSFEQVSGLTTQSVSLSAQVVNPFDPGLLSRLLDATVPLGFPVLIRIEPPAVQGLSFRGVVTISLYTHNLTFLSTLPLRIFSASPGEPFEDITESTGKGSYRARGQKGQFSEFLIALDLRPVGATINAKLDRVDQILSQNGSRINSATLNDLTALAAAIRADSMAGRTRDAIVKSGNFIDLVKQNSGTAIPDVWRASHDVVNAAGLLRAAAETLRFSLNQKLNQGLF